MAITFVQAGDRYNLGWNIVPKVAKSGYTPTVGDLVVVDPASNAVDVIATTEGPYGIIESIGGYSSTNLLAPLSVVELVSGTQLELPYLTAVTLGQKAVFDTGVTHGSTVDRTKIGSDATNGTGTIIAKDANVPHGTGHCVVLFM